MKKKLICFALSAAMAVFSMGCSSNTETAASKSAQASPETVSSAAPVVQTSAPELDIEALVAAGLFSKRDFDTSYDAAAAVRIELGDGILCDEPSVKVENGRATISVEGTYILSGSTTEGMIIIDADKTAKVQLVLDNVSITSGSSAPIYVKQADKVFITLAENSVNELTNGGSFEAIDENNIDAAVFSKDDLTINGSGSLTVSSPAGHGIASNDSLSITGGSFEINCASNGLKANDDICIADGAFTITSGKDAVQAEHDENPDKGYVYIAGGSYDISAEGDGVSASAYMQIDGGSFTLITGGGHGNAAEQSSDMWGQFMPGAMGRGRGGMGRGEKGGMLPGDMENGSMSPPDMPEGGMPQIPEGGMPEMPEGMTPPDFENMERPEIPQGGGFGAEQPEAAEAQAVKASGDGSSMKAFKAKGEMTINGGSFTVDSADDAFHSDLNMSINAGKFEIAAGDDAFHAEENLVVNGGAINISSSYEGLEALHLSVFAGDISIVADDDGLNAAGGTDSSGFGGRDGMFGGAMGQNSGGSITIAGGNISITAYGDGLDANGSIEITGGSTTVCGPTYGDTAILDYYRTATISGGSFMGSGSSMMAQNFSEATQGVVWAGFGQTFPAGTELEVTDSSGSKVMSFVPALDFEMVIVSNPELSQEENYSVSIAATP